MMVRSLSQPDEELCLRGVQVFEVQGLGSGSPELLFERNVGESIRSLETGIVNTAVRGPRFTPFLLKVQWKPRMIDSQSTGRKAVLVPDQPAP